MRRSLSLALAVLALAGCAKKAETAEEAPSSKGRYQVAGHYSPGRMWTQAAKTDANRDPKAAAPADDDEIIIVADSISGEVRQCGNLSGVCLSMNPWSRPATALAPVPLEKHAADLDAEEAAKAANKPGR